MVEKNSDARKGPEQELWTALDLDKVGKEMAETSPSGDRKIVMGTGATVNACYSCSNSATTAGCGTCA